jgi:hypothetical protein
MARWVDGLLLALFAYFVAMNLTVERCYCHMTVEACAASGWPLASTTLDFCKSYNPLFLARPEWMRVATCFSAYGFVCGYALCGIAAAFDLWARLRLPIAIFIGAKVYGILFYHYMEFTSASPPPELLPYFGVEGPYLVSIALVVRRLAALPGEASDSIKKRA